MRSTFVIGLSVVWLAGCLLASCDQEDPQNIIGKDFSMVRHVAIKQGVTTMKEVEGLLGRPFRVESRPNGKSRWHYYVRKESTTYMLGIFPSSTRVIEHRLDIVFDGPLVFSIDRESNSFTK